MPPAVNRWMLRTLLVVGVLSLGAASAHADARSDARDAVVGCWNVGSGVTLDLRRSGPRGLEATARFTERPRGGPARQRSRARWIAGVEAFDHEVDGLLWRPGAGRLLAAAPRGQPGKDMAGDHQMRADAAARRVAQFVLQRLGQRLGRVRQAAGALIRVATRVSEMSLKVLDGFQTPVAALVQSGALDLSKPGNLVAFIPKRPAAIVDAKDDRIVIDALRVPSLAANPKVKKALAIATPVLGVRAIRSKDDHLDVHLKATLSGLPRPRV